MSSQLQWLWGRLNANYWFYPALFSLSAAALAMWLVYLDRNGFAAFLNTVTEIVPARPGGASNMLTVIAGSMIGVASTVFSITIAAVAYASGTYGPRLLTNFMEDKGNQLSLAIFIGTFVYAITVLRTVRAENEMAATAQEASATALPGFVPQLSLLIGYLLMAVSVAVLVYFLNHIPASIRINTVLEGIGRRLIDEITEEFANPDNGNEPADAPEGTPVAGDGTGYVQLIDFTALDVCARTRGGRIALKVRAGDFVHRGMPLVEWCGNENIDDAARQEVIDAFVLGASRTPAQDLDFLIDELVEIALRALSPGINDPFTAITALHWLGAGTAELGTRDLSRREGAEVGPEDGERRVFPLPDGFAHYVGRGFGRMRGAVATSVPAVVVAWDALRNAATPITNGSRLDLLRQEGDHLLAQARLSHEGPDLADVEAGYLAFVKAFARAR